MYNGSRRCGCTVAVKSPAATPCLMVLIMLLGLDNNSHQECMNLRAHYIQAVKATMFTSMILRLNIGGTHQTRVATVLLMMTVR